MMRTDEFNSIWCVDFEYSCPPGEKPSPICMVAYEIKTDKKLRHWFNEFGESLNEVIYFGSRDLLVAYYASAELGCFLVLNFPPPKNVLDLYVEFKNATNGKQVPSGYGLLGALSYYGLDSIDASEKTSMRDLAIRGGPFTHEERMNLLNYCESDVVALTKLLKVMMPAIKTSYALLRGTYMKSTARIEHLGVPIDGTALQRLRSYWTSIQDELISQIDRPFGVYENTSFRRDRFANYLIRENIPWPRLPGGELALDDCTFKDMVRVYPHLAPLRELRNTISQLRLSNLAVGSDSRNRCLLSAFQSKTGRNQPSNSKFIFGPSAWLRGLIKPQENYGLAYIDWEQQEFGIAAALSGDAKMKEAYASGDPYLAFAKQAGVVPPEATKSSHSEIREQFKACVLAVQYGMGETSLSARIGKPVATARQLLELHRKTYPVFWQWSDGVVDHAMLKGYLYTVFDWTIYVGSDANPRSLRNFPMQANGAEMLRLALSQATELGISVCAPVHDAILIEAPLDTFEEAISQTQEIMSQASEIILDGFQLRTDVKRVIYPERYMDPRGEKMWTTIWDLIDRFSAANPLTNVLQSVAL